MSHPLLEVARGLGPLVRAHADENEQRRRLADPLVAALRPTGLLTMLLPAAYGGPEVDPLVMVDAVEELAFHAGVSVDELRDYEFTPPDGKFDLTVADRVGTALEKLEAVVEPKVDQGGVPREDAPRPL